MNPRLSSNDVPWALLGRHFAGELSPTEAEALHKWIASDPGHAEIVAELKRLWTDVPKTHQRWDVEAAVQRVMQPARASGRVIPLQRFYREPESSRWRRVLRTALGTAAVLGVLAGGAWIVGYRPFDGAWTIGGRLVGAASTAVNVSKARTLRGERATLRLPDGSEVTLGPASTIRYAIARDHGPRAVELEGEGYFTVTHDEHRPFTVRTVHGVATDLGTEFNVRAYSEDSTVQVAVRSGKVVLARATAVGAVDSGMAEIVLEPNDLGVVTAGGRLYAQRDADIGPHLAWTKGRLDLRATPLRDAVTQLSRWYDFEIHLSDSLSARRQITASFHRESVVDALRLIAATLELRLDVRGDTAVLGTQ